MRPAQWLMVLAVLGGVGCGRLSACAGIGMGAEAPPPPTRAPVASPGEHADPVQPVPVMPLPAEGQGSTKATPCDEARRDGASDVTVSWSGVRSTESCFYFSGPGELGRDDQLGNRARLELRGGEAILEFGGGARFTGSVTGDGLRLRRVSEHDFHGAWRVTEHITGRWGGDPGQYLDSPCPEGSAVLRAEYRYEECAVRDPAQCPGPCTISATVRVR